MIFEIKEKEFIVMVVFISGKTTEIKKRKIDR